MPLYDYLIVGSGLFGATVAHELLKHGKRCLVVEKRGHVGGNIFTKELEGIHVHQYGAHIFHTKYEDVWKFVTSLVHFDSYINSPIANYKGALFNLPFNMNTFYQMWGCATPIEAERKIESQRRELLGKTPQNLEEQAIALVGRDIYQKLIKGYTEKQWGRDCKDLPASIIKRLPVRYTYDNNYFNDPYQGIPTNGYTDLVIKLLHGTEVLLNTDFIKRRNELQNLADQIVYTGQIDEYYDYCFGSLEYRRVSFQHKIFNTENFQGVAVINYTDRETPYTRSIEHRHFMRQCSAKKTVVSYEYPESWAIGEEPYYPISDDKNNELYKRYRQLADSNQDKVFFGGRLGSYQYFNMDQVILSALNLAKQLLNKE